ncbi:hypothetical protein PVAG01_07903 [Phlyctema vagabunda]|uniref:Uncharacterized protein n=1 Tax=Phlyctema vagabunda TaxID=108571 RepID=A0ABR4PDQ7_9HELO
MSGGRLAADDSVIIARLGRPESVISIHAVHFTPRQSHDTTWPRRNFRSVVSLSRVHSGDFVLTGNRWRAGAQAWGTGDRAKRGFRNAWEKGRNVAMPSIQTKEWERDMLA